MRVASAHKCLVVTDFLLILLLNFASKRFNRYELRKAATMRCSIKKAFLKNLAIYRETTVLESLCNKVIGPKACNVFKKTLQHSFFPVNITKFLRTPILKNICERLLLNFHLKSFPVIIITWPKQIKSFSGYYQRSYPVKLMLIMNLFYDRMNFQVDDEQTEAQKLHLESVTVLAMTPIIGIFTFLLFAKSHFLESFHLFVSFHLVSDIFKLIKLMYKCWRNFSLIFSGLKDWD